MKVKCRAEVTTLRFNGDVIRHRKVAHRFLLTAVSKSPFFTLNFRVDFRVCSAVRVRFRQDLVIFTDYTYTHAEVILIYAGL